MHWTKTKPNRPGWYWYQNPQMPDKVDGPVRVGYGRDGQLRAELYGWFSLVQNIYGEWSNEPIPEPEERDDDVS